MERFVFLEAEQTAVSAHASKKAREMLLVDCQRASFHIFQNELLLSPDGRYAAG